jgi:large subunit ribosomal protein L4
MASAKIFNMQGKEVGTAELSDAVFSVEPNATVTHQVVTGYLSAQRQGNHETKTRSEVSGGGIKPMRQKGTGRARRGSIREPVLRGGGTVWGPHKRSYRKKVTTGYKRKALCCALSDRVRQEALCLLDQVTVNQPQVKPVMEMLASLALTGKKTLFVMPQVEPVFLKSTGNVPRVTVRTASDVNAMDVLNAQAVVVVQGALSILEERLA